jgi:transposase-like protein
VNFEGQKAVLGLWIAENEGAKFWMGVLNELKNRGVEDILIACRDGLSGFPDAARAVYPQTRVVFLFKISEFRISPVRGGLRYVA